MTLELERLVHRLVPVVDELEKVPDRSQQLIEQLFQYLSSIQGLQTQTISDLSKVLEAMAQLTNRLETLKKVQQNQDQEMKDLIRLVKERVASQGKLESRVNALIELLNQTVSPSLT
jgi:chromosome segregation ATPase